MVSCSTSVSVYRWVLITHNLWRNSLEDDPILQLHAFLTISKSCRLQELCLGNRRQQLHLLSSISGHHCSEPGMLDCKPSLQNPGQQCGRMGNQVRNTNCISVYYLVLKYYFKYHPQKKGETLRAEVSHPSYTVCACRILNIVETAKIWGTQIFKH